MPEHRYHINQRTGNPNICKAQPGKCPLRSRKEVEPPHYTNKSEARAAYETEQSSQNIPAALNKDERRIQAFQQELRDEQHRAEELLQYYMDMNGCFSPPRTEVDHLYDEERDDFYTVVTSPAPAGFTFIGSGVEVNVYLHETTQTVFKVPNAESARSGWTEEESDIQSGMNTLHQKAYALLDTEMLKEHHMEYVETHFLNVKDKLGRNIPVLTQPYLNPDEFTPYVVDDETLKHLQRSQPLDDLYPENMQQCKTTGKIFLYDCLYLSLDQDF